MIIQTLFNFGGRFELGEVEVRLMPGIPNLHVVGSPDPQIREAGIKLKSAVRAAGFRWPRGQQILVNLRPNHFKKTSHGVELAVALGILGATGQLEETLQEKLRGLRVYGEVTLDGRVLAPHDLPRALTSSPVPLLTGTAATGLREGEWLELASLKDSAAIHRARYFDWDSFFERPALPPMSFHADAVLPLLLCAHMKLNVMVAGPQGSGKSTWAKVLYSLSPRPDVRTLLEREEWVGRDENLKWRPLECPHHSLSPLSMVGGSYPIQPGVVTRVHGGVLLMDEFLEFSAATLEALREPLETGTVEIARKGAREKLPAQFQLVATTNLCPCGKLVPRMDEKCRHPLPFCSSTVRRLSGPLLDRFDLLVFSQSWTLPGRMVPVSEMAESVARMDRFRTARGEVEAQWPDWIDSLTLNFRRRRSLLRVARGIADLEESKTVESTHFSQAIKLVADSITELNQLFA